MTSPNLGSKRSWLIGRWCGAQITSITNSSHWRIRMCCDPGRARVIKFRLAPPRFCLSKNNSWLTHERRNGRIENNSGWSTTLRRPERTSAIVKTHLQPSRPPKSATSLPVSARSSSARASSNAIIATRLPTVQALVNLLSSTIKITIWVRKSARVTYGLWTYPQIPGNSSSKRLTTRPQLVPYLSTHWASVQKVRCCHVS